MQRKIVFATNNRHKLDEVRQIVGSDIEIMSLADIGCAEDIPETSATIEGNAMQKCRYVAEHYGCDCFADDTGLEVEELGGAPGVMSARYAGGAGHDSAANMALLLRNMQGADNRAAQFRTVIALNLGGEYHTFEGIVRGKILDTPAGAGGFGYDPVFVPEGWTKTFAEATEEEKNAESHRGRAMRKLIEYFKNCK
ncbi:MAG: non-canonical purine NTP diphosphatase [Muribaculaceae bacterium]